MYIGIRDGKVWDICNPLENKRLKDAGIALTQGELDEFIYIEYEGDVMVGDTWDFENNCSLKDSPQRFIEPPKSKVELLEDQVNLLKIEIEKLKKKTK